MNAELLRLAELLTLALLANVKYYYNWGSRGCTPYLHMLNKRRL